eukprot:3261233-Prymnesium_polylepis.1
MRQSHNAATTSCNCKAGVLGSNQRLIGRDRIARVVSLEVEMSPFIYFDTYLVPSLVRKVGARINSTIENGTVVRVCKAVLGHTDNGRNTLSRGLRCNTNVK